MKSRVVTSLAGPAALLACAALLGCTALREPLSDAGCFFERPSASWQTLDSHNVLIWPLPSRHAYRLGLHEGFDTIPAAPELQFVDGNRDGVVCADGWDALSIRDRNATRSPDVATIVLIARVNSRTVDTLREKYADTLGRQQGGAVSAL